MENLVGQQSIRILSLWLCVLVLFLQLQWYPATADCLADETLNDFFVVDQETGRRKHIPRFQSCCMQDVCGLTCPQEHKDPDKGYGIAIGVFIFISFIVGSLSYLYVNGSTDNFFVAGRSLPLWVLAVTLGGQAIDSNTLLGNVDLSFRFSFWDGAVIPIGLGLSLILNAVFLAEHVNKDMVLTLPDILAKRYGKVVEILASIATLVSFIMLLAGNLVGMGVVVGYLWNISESGGIWLSASAVWAYTVGGGLFSVAYTDVVQGSIGWLGCLISAYWLIAGRAENLQPAPPPSIGFPGYIYPDGIGDNGICDMYEGVPCSADPSLCCYNSDLWCPNQNGAELDGICDRYDRGAYPVGDQPIYRGQMTDSLALSPFPNAVVFNWATTLILAFGNLAALDFQARCMAAESPRSASLGCYIGAFVTFFIGLPFAFLGSIVRSGYGPDSVYGEFDADSCSAILGLPTCAAWLPDKIPFLRVLAHDVPPLIGGWGLIGIVAATMSTADGAILALGTVMANNLFRHFDCFWPNLVTPDKLLLFARISTLPLTIAATTIAAYYRSHDDSAAGATGYLLIVAFDIVLATVVVPLFGAYYAKKPSPRAALLSMLGGGFTRILSEIVLPKDGSLLFPFPFDEYLNYGSAASALPPAFTDVNGTKWNPEVEECVQERFRDYTGIDSLSAAALSLILFVSVQYIEHRLERPLFLFPGGTGYDKKTIGQESSDASPWLYPMTVLFSILAVVFVIFTVMIVVLKNNLLY